MKENKRILFASDLDNTLIYSYKKIRGDSICVETKEGKALSYMTKTAYAELNRIYSQVTFVPVTTRSLEQYERISLLQSGVPEYALTSNGGILLVDGKEDRSWKEETLRLISGTREQMQRALELLGSDKSIYLEPRFVDEIFVFAKSSNVSVSMRQLEAVLDLEEVFIDHNGDKLYVFPKILHKGLALQRLKEYLNPDMCIAAGDSNFDVPMLLEADLAVIPTEADFTELLPGRETVYAAKRPGIHFGDEVLRVVTKHIG